MSAPETPEPDRIAGAPHPSETVGVIGHADAAGDVLSSWGAGRLHHAWLLRGPRGVGKASFAYALAGAVLRDGSAPPRTLSVPDGDPVARRIVAGSEPRLHVVRRPLDPRTKKLRAEITVDAVRALRAFFALSAANGGWRVAVIDAADEMNRAAQNALLKILEEPPDDALILMVAHAPGRLLPTIRSRCRAVEFGALSADEMARVFEAIGAQSDDMAALAELSRGAPGEALRLCAQAGDRLYAGMVRVLGGAPGMDRARLHGLAAQVEGRDAAGRYVLALELTETLLQRLALAGAGAARAEAVAGEAALWAALSPSPRHARLWADASCACRAAAARAREVNLDPAQTILNIWLRIDAAAAAARAL